MNNDATSRAQPASSFANPRLFLHSASSSSSSSFHRPPFYFFLPAICRDTKSAHVPRGARTEQVTLEGTPAKYPLLNYRRSGVNLRRGEQASERASRLLARVIETFCSFLFSPSTSFFFAVFCLSFLCFSSLKFSRQLCIMDTGAGASSRRGESRSPRVTTSGCS